MIRATKTWQEFEKRQLAEPLPLAKAIAIFQGFIDEARALGVWPPADPLEGIENDIRLARVLNSCR